MSRNDLPLSLKSDTFNALTSDFDQVLRATLQGMSDTSQDVAEVNVKVKITLTPDSAPDFSVHCVGEQQTRAISKPKFEHTVTAVIQRKEKRTGTLSGNYELVWDLENHIYVMRPVDDGQTSIFDEETQEAQAEANRTALPPAGKVIDAEYTVADEKAEQDDDGTDPEAFDWLKQFVGRKLRCVEAAGNITVRSEDNRVILSSATDPSAPFYCPREVLLEHTGDNLICTEAPNALVILCEDCDEIIFSMPYPKTAGGEQSEDGEEGTQEAEEGADRPEDENFPYQDEGDPFGDGNAEDGEGNDE